MRKGDPEEWVESGAPPSPLRCCCLWSESESVPPPPLPLVPPTLKGDPACLGSAAGCFGSEIGENVDFHLLEEVEDEEDEEEETSLFMLLPPDLRPNKLTPRSPSPTFRGLSLLSREIVAIFLSIRELELSAGYPASSSSELGGEE